MTSPATDRPPPVATPLQRRARYALRAGALLLAITATCLFAGVLTSRLHARLDVTATRQHRLSERTLGLLARLDRPHEIILAGNFRGLDAAGRQRSEDVLAALANASDKLRITRIDTGSAQGLEQYDALLERCVQQFRSSLDEVTAQVSGAADAATSRAADLEQLAELIEQVRRDPAADPSIKSIDKALESRAAMARVKAEDLRAAADRARETLTQTVGRAPIPPVDEAARILRAPLNQAAEDAATLHRDLDRLAKSEQTPPALTAAVRPIIAASLTLRDAAARAVAALDLLRTPPILGAARALERSGGAVIIAEPRPTDVDAASKARSRGLTAIEFDALFPPAQGGDRTTGGRADQRFRAEELLATALGVLNNPDAPILVVVHGEGVSIAPEFAYFRALRDRLALRGIDMVEWATALSPEPPALTTLDPGGKRPVIYLAIPNDPSSPEGAARMARLASTVSRLWSDGKPLLLTVNPSSLPSIGEKDPMVEFLAPAGVQVDTARTLLQQFRTESGPVVSPEFLLPDPGIPDSPERHPISGTVAGLPMYHIWPVPIRTAPPEDDSSATLTPLLVVPASSGVWAESEWLQFRQLRPQHRAMVRNPPAPDSARDDTKGPWTIAAAIERRLPGRSVPQRAVVVGSNGWFFDAIAAVPVAEPIDGRRPLLAPGNLEFFEACAYWLAGQDELIAPSPAAYAVPLVPPIARGNLLAVRWLLVLGLPTLVLAAGVAWRVIRG